jgi:hypothetical protein
MTLFGDVDDLGRACQASGSGRSLDREKFLLKPPAWGVGRDVMASSASLPCHRVHELMAGASAGVKPRLRSGRSLGAAAGSLAVALGRLS